jgi:ferredoxin
MLLKKLRVIVSVIIFSLITFYFIDFREVLPLEFDFLADIQFIPALSALNFVVLSILIILTLIFGRVYCSSICPMGIFQDIADWFSKKIRSGKKKKRYKYSKAKNILRWSVLAILTLTVILFGTTAFLGFFDPYSAYGRIAVNVFKPIYLWGNNILEAIFTGFGNYTFYRMEVYILSVFALIVSLVTFFAIGFLAWKYGRTYCNTICPVGTILGFLSKYSLFKIKLDESRCNSCGACERNCKSSCINSKQHHIDYSRCVTCFNCIGSCKTKALTFSPVSLKKEKVENAPKETTMNIDRRRFLTATFTTALAAPKILAQDKLMDIRILDNGTAYNLHRPIAPPGAQSIAHLLTHCTSCHLCISKCPSKVLKPSFKEYGLKGIMQPVMYYDKGFCNFDCTICTDVCPNDALHKLTVEEKHLTQVGKVVFLRENCIVITEGTSCGACSEHCPTQAVSMKPYIDGLTLPHIEEDICVGCGGCEYVCPVRPYKAIYVEPNEVHQEAKPFDKDEQIDVELDGFGF